MVGKVVRATARFSVPLPRMYRTLLLISHLQLIPYSPLISHLQLISYSPLISHLQLISCSLLPFALSLLCTPDAHPRIVVIFGQTPQNWSHLIWCSPHVDTPKLIPHLVQPHAGALNSTHPSWYGSHATTPGVAEHG